ncbi:MAG: hypothetical protein RJB08_1915 [Actinomycetota bacterium]|jgi:murein DD-endopeptidase MepM/ murein hydrolase activator NlpD
MVATTWTTRKISILGLGAGLAAAAFSLIGPTAASAASNGAAKPAAVAAPALPRFGQSGDAVKALQQALVGKGFTLVGGVDGVFSPRTRAALRNFQTVIGYKATGVLDRKTAKVLGLLPVAASAQTTVPATTVAPTTVAPTTIPVPTTVVPATVAWSVEMFPVLGAKGDAVSALQNALIGAGVEVFGGADGIFGNGTKTAISKFQTAKGLTTTGALDESTAIELGLLPRPVLAVNIAVFPVKPACYFIDTYGDPRGTDRQHEGVDIIAKKGQEILAVADGTITKIYTADSAKLSGNAVRLTAADGTYFFYAHLDTFTPGLTVGAKVVAGQVIGGVGSTGDTNTDHLHFEVHPKGGEAVNPYPIVKAVDACRK